MTEIDNLINEHGIENLPDHATARQYCLYIKDTQPEPQTLMDWVKRIDNLEYLKNAYWCMKKSKMSKRTKNSEYAGILLGSMDIEFIIDEVDFNRNKWLKKGSRPGVKNHALVYAIQMMENEQLIELLVNPDVDTRRIKRYWRFIFEEFDKPLSGEIEERFMMFADKFMYGDISHSAYLPDLISDDEYLLIFLVSNDKSPEFMDIVFTLFDSLKSDQYDIAGKIIDLIINHYGDVGKQKIELLYRKYMDLLDKNSVNESEAIFGNIDLLMDMISYSYIKESLEYLSEDQLMKMLLRVDVGSELHKDIRAQLS